MFVGMTSKISKVANVALQVFNQHSLKVNSSLYGGMLTQSSLSAEKLSQLMSLLSKIDGRDVGFDTNWVKSTVKADGSNVSAPVLYVHIMENEVFSLGIFVLRPGSRIPLHDHPNMFGLVKVIYGNVRCRSFSRVLGNKPCIKSFIPRLCKWQIDDLIAAVPYQDIVLDAGSPATLLTPASGNFHELITVGDEGAAFVDILAPPYDHLLGKRECHFYHEISIPRGIPPTSVPEGSLTHSHPSSSGTVNGTGDLSVATEEHHPPPAPIGAANNEESSQQQYVYLAETHQPKDYWCESAEYRGPRVI